MDISKPTVKRPIGIRTVKEESFYIAFDAENEEVATELSEFGRVTKHDGLCWTLIVDARFDFDEVLFWIGEKYGAWQSKRQDVTEMLLEACRNAYKDITQNVNPMLEDLGLAPIYTTPDELRAAIIYAEQR